MSSAQQSDREPSASGASETRVAQTVVTVRRSPRYLNFMILGAVLGVVGALVLTVSYPQNSEFGPTQVFGFLLLAGIVIGVTVGAVVAIVIDRVTSRSTTTAVADRLDVYGSIDVEAADAASDSPFSGDDSDNSESRQRR